MNSTSQFLRIPLIILLAFLCHTANAGVLLNSFDPSFFYSAVGAPTLAEVESLDSSVGLSDFIIEDFEDITLIDGVTLNVDLDLNSHGSGANFFLGAWDGTKALQNELGSSRDLVISLSGFDTVAMGISGIHASERILVNGIDFGEIDDLLGFQSNSDFNARSIFIRADRAPGGPPITEVRIRNDGTSSDFIQIDHLAVWVVPEPTTLAVFLSGLGVFFNCQRASRDDQARI